jgi:hypothetical protein
MPNQTYTYKSLIHTYINTHRQDFPHEDFTNYYVGLLAALENAFGISFNGNKTPKPVLWMLFRSTVTSYLQIRHPWSTFLEAGLLHIRLENAGDAGEHIKAYSRKLAKLADESRQLHMTMLDELFEMIYGKIDTVVTSEELRQAGFDDNAEPKIEDYDEFI